MRKLYVHNADNSVRQLVLPRGKNMTSGIVIDGKTLEEIKKWSERKFNTNSSKPKKIDTPPRTKKKIPKFVDREQNSEIFYNGFSTNFVFKLDPNYLKELERQVEKKFLYTKAMKDEERRLVENVEKETKHYFAHLKRMAENERRRNKENQQYLMGTIKENEKKKREEHARRGLVPVEKYYLGRKQSAERFEHDLESDIKEKLARQRKELDDIVINKIQREFKRYEEKENNKLNEATQYTTRITGDEPVENNVYKDTLQCIRDMKILEAQIKVANDKIREVQKWNQFEAAHCEQKTENVVARDDLRKIKGKGKMKDDEEVRRKWFAERMKTETKMNDYYEDMKTFLNANEDCATKNHNLKKVCVDIKHQKSLIRQMEDDRKKKEDI